MNILDLIGNTPLMSIGNVYFKMEMFNPTGSIKDRIAKAMILDFVQDKNQPQRYTMVEATSGNTGISVAMVCAQMGLNCKIYAPIGTSHLKIRMMRAYGADVATVHDTISECIDCAKAWSDGSFYHYLDQFNNKCNVKAQETMAREVKYGYGRVHTVKHFDAIVAGVGTGGTIMGLRNIFPEADLFILQIPDSEHIEGICDGVKLSLIPKKLKLNTINVSFAQAMLTAKWLVEQHGIHCGVSGGANYYASTMIQKKYAKILTILPDSGDRYL